MMLSISQVYRKACREIALPPAEKALFMKLLREISVNAVKSKKDWNKKEDFIALFFTSAGRFPELAINPWSTVIGEWAAKHFPFQLSPAELRSLWD
jgi:hypothetical protein